MRTTRAHVLAAIGVLTALLSIAAPASAIEPHPTGNQDVVLRIATGGGFVPEQVRLAEIPEVTVYGTGRVVVLGPTTLEYPGAALPNLHEFFLTPKGVNRLIRLAADAGVFTADSPDYGTLDVTDNPTTTVTVNARGEERSVSVYALGFEDDRLTERQQENRRLLQRLIDRAGDDRIARRFVAGEIAPYQPTAVEVYALPYLEGDVEGPQPETRDWPLLDRTITPGTGDEYPCVTVSGADLGPVLEAAKTARENTRWRSRGETYELVFRPLLPDERGCGPDEDVVVRIEVGRNGWGGENTRFTRAEIVVHADGRVTVDGENRTIDAADVDRILRAAGKAGLAGSPPEFGEPGITDQGNVVVELSPAGGPARRVSVYALGMENVDRNHLGLDRSQLRARRQLASFIDFVIDLTGTA